MKDLTAVKAAIAEALDDLKAEWFRPQMKLTFIARDPSNDECNIIVTSDPDPKRLGELLIEWHSADWEKSDDPRGLLKKLVKGGAS